MGSEFQDFRISCFVRLKFQKSDFNVNELSNKK